MVFAVICPKYKKMLKWKRQSKRGNKIEVQLVSFSWIFYFLFIFKWKSHFIISPSSFSFLFLPLSLYYTLINTNPPFTLLWNHSSLFFSSCFLFLYETASLSSNPHRSMEPMDWISIRAPEMIPKLLNNIYEKYVVFVSHSARLYPLPDYLLVCIPNHKEIQIQNSRGLSVEYWEFSILSTSIFSSFKLTLCVGIL